MGYLDFDLEEDLQTSIEESDTNLQIGFCEGQPFTIDMGEPQDHAALYNRNKEDSHPIKAITGLQEILDAKVNTEEGKGLSTNDFTDDYKEKLEVLDYMAPIPTEQIYNIVYDGE